MRPASTFATASAGLLFSALFCTQVFADGFDEAPDYSKDKYPPYPSLTKEDGSKIPTDELKGIRLYGWAGCNDDRHNAITEAFDDLYKLAGPLANTIDWSDEPARHFWGQNTGPNKLPDDRRTQIQQIFKNQLAMSTASWTGNAPSKGWQSLWIEARCSGGDNSGDPNDICKDQQPNSGQCGVGGQPVGGGATNTEAVAESLSANSALKYNRITFCNDFENLRSLTKAIDETKGKSQAIRLKLENWGNQARVLLHEVTHLDWFMNTDPTGPLPMVDDLQIEYDLDGNTVNDWGYGPYAAKLLKNYGQKEFAGFYSQRNADNYAWFAVGSYVKSQTQFYPRLPNPTKVLNEDPKNSGGGDVKAADGSDVSTSGLPRDDMDADATDDGPGYDDGFHTPNCPDIGHDTKTANSSTSTSDSPETSGPQADPKCDTNALSGIPFNVFSGSSIGSTDVYGKFCDAVDAAQTTKLSWSTDATGTQKSSKMRFMKRTPPPNTSGYSSYTFALNWEPSSSAGSCSSSCKDSFAAIARSPCGHQGGTQNGMTAEASVDVACGTYSYKITGDEVPAPQGPPKPFLSTQYCFPSDVFGEHGDISPDWQRQYIGWACAGTADHTIKKGDPSTFIDWHTTTNGVPYKYTVTWEDNCSVDVTEMNAYKPLADNDATCMSMFKNDYKDCFNGGIGGSISAGCVKYEFKANLD